ncbi:hypothetical protein DPEC_G00015020, partial [Dallia pectoralis]
MAIDSPNTSLKSRLTMTTDNDSYISTACGHFLLTNVINVVLSQTCSSMDLSGVAALPQRYKGGLGGVCHYRE